MQMQVLALQGIRNTDSTYRKCEQTCFIYAQIDDDIADIMNTVDEEPIKEKKKKKKKDKEKDQEEGDDEKPTKRCTQLFTVDLLTC